MILVVHTNPEGMVDILGVDGPDFQAEHVIAVCGVEDKFLLREVVVESIAGRRSKDYCKMTFERLERP